MNQQTKKQISKYNRAFQRRVAKQQHGIKRFISFYYHRIMNPTPVPIRCSLPKKQQRKLGMLPTI